MKVGELIAYVNAVKGREFPPEVYDVWLNEVEGMVQTRIHLVPSESVLPLVRDPDDPTAFDETVLSVPFPYDKLYAPYIEARAEYAAGDYDGYSNSMALFEQFFTEYMAHYAQVFRPADRRKRRALGINF